MLLISWYIVCTHYTLYILLHSYHVLVICTDTAVVTHIYMHVLCSDTYSKSMDQSGKVANSVCGQLNRENECFPVHVRA